MTLLAQLPLDEAMSVLPGRDALAIHSGVEN